MLRLPNKMDEFRLEEGSDDENDDKNSSNKKENGKSIDDSVKTVKSDIEEKLKASGFVSKVESILKSDSKSVTSGATSYVKMVEFTKMLTRLDEDVAADAKETMEDEVISQVKSSVMEIKSNPDCQCICHPEKCDTDDGECKCKVLSIASIWSKPSTVKEEMPKEELNPVQSSNEKETERPGLSAEDIQLLSDELEPLEDKSGTNDNDKDDIKSLDGPVVVIPKPPQDHAMPIVLLPRPLNDSQRECNCYMRRLKPEEIPKTPLTPIEETSPVLSEAVINEVRSITTIHSKPEEISKIPSPVISEALVTDLTANDELPEEKETEVVTRKCQEQCTCSCHPKQSRHDVRFEPGVLPSVEPSDTPQVKCVDLCKEHCPPRESEKPSLIRAEDSLLVTSKRISSLEKVRKEQSETELEEKTESPRTSEKKSFIKRLSNSLRRSK